MNDKIAKAIVETYGIIDSKSIGKIALNKALDAMEYRIPMKPIDIDKSYPVFTCGNCQSRVTYSNNKETYRYCCVCGQRIDWDV